MEITKETLNLLIISKCRNGSYIDWYISINPNGNKKDQLKTLVKKTAGNAKG
ncbi:hypothetical protein P9B97_02225 [Bacillus paralicheniformis]|uniref:hypothetical protein n=1 Tax=Bacillus paralicheniformis TaxID=1648923 RepID=UPI002DBA90CA|nr:hypothetical protein [Bacillus paralicheniformis]MEC1050901.1 hypothetical protein [Bacillus paralicheniformis]MEC1087724.1 hypothetical protein [Bacillus paralicheniformis]MEC1108793.1 hypothetical protein [Bacillus paralicheniformis]MEC1137152.1 hypothetical protein [Bacillus paralicheniformis]MEC1148438.1 hypothetical protein [Bacillus paralicheniformis]